MSALAGEIADELKVGGSANRDLVPLMLARLREGAATAGRRAGSTGLVLGAVTVVDDDGDAARDRARSAVAMYFEVVASLDPTLDVPAASYPTIFSIALRSPARPHRWCGRSGTSLTRVPREWSSARPSVWTPREVYGFLASECCPSSADLLLDGTPQSR